MGKSGKRKVVHIRKCMNILINSTFEVVPVGKFGGTIAICIIVDGVVSEIKIENIVVTIVDGVYNLEIGEILRSRIIRNNVV